MNIKNKKIIFFDGDGTIWYPKATKRTKKPHWIYIDDATKDNYLEHLMLTPKARETLTALKKSGLALVLISTHPGTEEEANAVLKAKLGHFKLNSLFDGFSSAPEYEGGKGEVICRILKEMSIPKSKALMVGDSYYYDYLSARKVGVDGFFIENIYVKRPKSGRVTKNIIAGIEDLLK